MPHGLEKKQQAYSTAHCSLSASNYAIFAAILVIMAHKAGFVNIVGRPNVGKSTLSNALVGEKLSIITSKAQTTRHRILGFVNEDDLQIVFSDTPGIVYDPKYGLHKAMNGAIQTALEDADLILYITDIYEKPDDIRQTIEELKNISTDKLLLVNKIDQVKSADQLEELVSLWADEQMFEKIIPISALEELNLKEVIDEVRSRIPEHPPFYPKDELTDRNERFFVSEMIREKIFLQFKKEVPYSTEVIVEVWQDEEKLVRIGANIYVERPTQKSILIGKGGEAIKKLGTAARMDIEAFLDKHVYLELHVKVREKWRDNPNLLKGFGYNN